MSDTGIFIFAVMYGVVGAALIGFGLNALLGRTDRKRRKKAEEREDRYLIELLAAQRSTLRPPMLWSPDYCREMDCTQHCEKWALDEEEVGGAWCNAQQGPPDPRSSWRIAGICPEVEVQLEGGLVLTGKRAWAYYVALHAREEAAS